MPEFGSETDAIDVVKAFPEQVKGRTCKYLHYKRDAAHTSIDGISSKVLITGPSPGGLGAESAISLAHGAPSTIILVGRSAEKCLPTISAIKAINALTEVKFVEAEISSLKSVRKAAHSILEDKSIPSIDVIINNAGVMAIPLARNENGYEMHFACNHLGHFLLTSSLIPKLTPRTGRVVNVSSSGNLYSPVNWDDVHFRGENSYKPFSGYSQSKSAQILFSVALRKRGIKSYALHPGSIGTHLGVHLTPELMEDVTQTIFGLSLEEALKSEEYAKLKTLQQGCATQLVAALDPALDEQDDVFLSDCKPTHKPTLVHARALDEKDAERMWTLSEDLVGESFDF
ncbi:hypothetical protein NQ176_g1821 [Zarea fungicola]|uniref:Uncharacterized protein n=1 Tax=Zarea fungicola TaxID=93591 RepID=A0ACC1NR03_9HYPO|nr:hypothetical protein NQ176_g1821 [Lecanicillium fungicola]